MIEKVYGYKSSFEISEEIEELFERTNDAEGTLYFDFSVKDFRFIRFDYDRDAFEENIHPYSHCTINKEKVRIPVKAPLSPMEFINFILKHYWIANVLLGINSKKAYLISKPLVIIGGFDNKYYCYNNSKDSYFLLKSLTEKEKKEIENIILNLPYLKKFYDEFKEYPYLASRLIIQLMLNLTYIKNVSEEEYKYLLNLMKQYDKEIYEWVLNSSLKNYIFCKGVGDEVNQKLENLISNQISKKLLKIKRFVTKRVFNTKNNYLINLYVYLVNKIKTNNKWYYIESGDLKDCVRKIEKEVYQQKRLK